MNMARIVLVGGPFDGEEAFRVPPDHQAPAQIVWSGWFPWGWSAYLYEWRGERVGSDLIYRPPVWQDEYMRAGRGRRLGPDEIPPLLREDADLYAAGAAMLIKIKNDSRR